MPKREKIGRQNGKAPRSNDKQNSEFEEAMRRNGITNPNVKEQIHREISKQGYDLQDIDDLANDYKNSKGQKPWRYK